MRNKPEFMSAVFNKVNMLTGYKLMTPHIFFSLPDYSFLLGIYSPNMFCDVVMSDCYPVETSETLQILMCLNVLAARQCCK